MTHYALYFLEAPDHRLQCEIFTEQTRVYLNIKKTSLFRLQYSCQSIFVIKCLIILGFKRKVFLNLLKNRNLDIILVE